MVSDGGGDARLLSFVDLPALVLLQVFCPEAYQTLEDEKRNFLNLHPDALYPSDASVFSAATFELGGPHSRGAADGLPCRHQAAKWSILTALGNYSPLHGGHIILWDLGLVVCFPPGASILIPSGLVRYSFVRVRRGERRYSLLQWAGAGIARWFLNGHKTDVDFAADASRAGHVARENRRREAHEAVLDTFPLDSELIRDSNFYAYPGTWDPATEQPF